VKISQLKENVRFSYEYLTNDRQVNLYLQIVGELYRQPIPLGLGISNYRAQPQPDSIALGAFLAGKLIGGASLTVSFPHKLKQLKLESDLFSLKQAFPELDLEKKVYGELNYVAILPECRNQGKTLQELITQLVKTFKEQGGDYLFAREPGFRIKTYDRVYADLNLSREIFRNYPYNPNLGTFEEFKALSFVVTKVSLSGGF